MDIIAHSLSGILLGQIAMKEDTGAERKYYFSACIAGLILPDIDAVSYLFGPDAFAAVHQRFTHTLFAVAIFPLIIARIFHLWDKKHSYIRTYLLILIGMMIHISEDLIAHWPVEFFYPLSKKGWTFGLIQKDFSLIVDFIIIGGAMLSFYDKLAKHRRLAAVISFIIVGLYLFLGPGY
jgi:membrane-bound metal-dependent hydrolase YbcI (DUF457 family)